MNSYLLGYMYKEAIDTNPGLSVINKGIRSVSQGLGALASAFNKPPVSMKSPGIGKMISGVDTKRSLMGNYSNPGIGGKLKADDSFPIAPKPAFTPDMFPQNSRGLIPAAESRAASLEQGIAESGLGKMHKRMKNRMMEADLGKMLPSIKQ